VRAPAALDGGGVRGLSSLLIIEALMNEVQRLREEEGNPTLDSNLIPANSFRSVVPYQTFRFRSLARTENRVILA
jgi:hypothetical protein